MSELNVAFMIITTQNSKYFDFKGSIEQQIDILNLINSRYPVEWLDRTSHRKMYRYDNVMKAAINDFAKKYGSNDNIHPFEFRKFMEHLNEDEPFYLFRMDHYLANVTQLQLKKAVYQLEAIKNSLPKNQLWNKVKDDMISLLKDYKVQTVLKTNHRFKYKKRICRFCGRDESEGATFKNKAHAISEALGNKFLICYEECDECNKRLAKIEDNLSTAFLEIKRSFYGIKGKDGVNSVAGQNFVFDAKARKMVIGKNVHFDERENKICVKLEGRNIFTLQGLYKALVKIVIDIIDRKELSHLCNTIDWVNGILHTKELPPIKQMYCDTIYRQPFVELFIRKDKHSVETGPYCFANLFVCDLCFQFVVPFVDIDCGKMKSMLHILPFEKKMGANTAIYQWKSEWLDGSDTKPRTAWVELEYDKSDEYYTHKEHSISKKLKMLPPKWEISAIQFPPFNYTSITSSQLLECEVTNVNKSIILTDEWLYDTSNNIGYDLVVDETTGKILVNIAIELCNTGNTIHLLDMRVVKKYQIKNLTDVLYKEDDEYVSISKEFCHFVTSHALINLNPLLKNIHPMINVSALDLDIICNNLNCIFASL